MAEAIFIEINTELYSKSYNKFAGIRDHKRFRD
jgi:hypothetical protein